MSTPGSSGSAEHPKESLLAYVEGLLAGEERIVIEQHVRSCPQCAHEVSELDRVIAWLRTYKEIFCPEPWLLQEYADSGQDPDERIRAHLKECGSCLEELSSMQHSAEELSIPPRVREAFRENYAVQPEPAPEAPKASVLSVLCGSMSLFFRLPVMAIGAAAAALVVVVLLYPRESVSPIIALSSIRWEEAAESPRTAITPKGLTLMGPQTRGAISVERRARVAVLLLLSGFDPPLNQNGVDSLYRGLAPSRELKQRIEVLDPARVKEALSGEDLKLPEARHIATKLGKDLDASAVLIIKLQSKESTISIEAELIEAASGESLGKESREPVTGGDITGELRASVSELLERAKLEK